MSIGIYKITSPTGKVYIGQSWNVEDRKRYYQSANCKKQILIHRSIVKHGWIMHEYEIIFVFNSTPQQKDLDQREIYFMKVYSDMGITLLNAKPGGFGGKLSEETKQKIRDKRKLQPSPTLGYKHSEQSRMNMSKAQQEIRRRKGHKKTIPHTLKKGEFWIGRKHSEESKQKQSLAKKGKPAPHKMKRVLNTETGEIFLGLKEAANSLDIQWKTLSARIVKKTKVKPICVFVD